MTPMETSASDSVCFASASSTALPSALPCLRSYVVTPRLMTSVTAITANATGDATTWDSPLMSDCTAFHPTS